MSIRTDEIVEKAVETFGPELTLTLAKCRGILEGIANGDIPVVKAKRHDVRGPDQKFQPEVITTQAGGFPVTHSGAVHPALREAFSRERGKQPPGNSDQSAGLNAYGETAGKPDEDPEGMRERNRRTLTGPPAAPRPARNAD
jgi:hypothetical protein